MRPRRNYIGQRYSRLVVKGDAEDIVQKTGKLTRQVFCECDCGTKIVARVNDLRTGNTKSCGCFYRDVVGKCNITHGMAISVGRGGAATTEYQIWRGMIRSAVLILCSAAKQAPFFCRFSQSIGQWLRQCGSYQLPLTMTKELAQYFFSSMR